MLDHARVVISSILAIRPILRAHYGATWPLALARAALRARRLMPTTRWAHRRDAEARYARALAVFPALCLDARERFNGNAQAIVRDVTGAIVESETSHIARTTGVFGIASPTERWHVYFDRGVIRGIGEFNENECIVLDPDRIHYRVGRCIFADLTADMGIPEMGQAVCDLDAPFNRRLMPSYRFHRGGSARNTIAHGHGCCEYIWDREDPAAP